MFLARAFRVLSLVAATTALAQEPQSSPSPTPTPGVSPAPSSPTPTPPAGASPNPVVGGVSGQPPAIPTVPVPSPSPTPTPNPLAVDEALPGPDELRIRSNNHGGGKGRLHYEGFVDLRFGQMRIQADSLDMVDETKPDGTSTQHLEAKGNVVFMSGTERISGETLRLDIDSGKGIFTNASGYLQPDVLFEAESIERIDADTYRLKGATFTACTQPNPRWMFKAQSATVDIDKRIKATMVGLRIKGVPTPLLIPYFQFPINPDQRSTGILTPRYGSGSIKGREIGLGFFWAMGRSVDQTFYYDYFSKTYAFGLGHEFRYIRNSSSRGNFKSYFTRPRGTSQFSYDLDWGASQALPHHFKATLSANFYSSLTLRQELQEDFDYASTRTRRGAAGIQGSIGPVYVKLEADTSDVFFPDGSIQRKRHLPQLRIAQSPKKIGRTGISFAFEGTAENLSQGSGFEEDTTGQSSPGSPVVLQSFSRFDFAPEITRSFSLPFLQVTPRFLVRQTRYGASLDDSGTLEGPALDRRFFETSVDMRGPKIFKLFSLPGNVYSDKFKHTIEPEFFYTFRSKFEQLNSLPNFDFTDYYPGTNQLLYGLTQRVYAKRRSRTGALVTNELVNLRIAQTYYVETDAKQGQFDFNYYSGSFIKGSHYSPVLGRLQVRPTLDASISLNVEYNPAFHMFPTKSLSARIGRPRMDVQAGWSRLTQVTDVIADRKPIFDTLRASGRVTLWPERVTVGGSLTYDRIESRMLQATAKVRYGIQCCGFSVEHVRFNTRRRSETKTTFQIDLAGIGAVGSFLGDKSAGQSNAGRK
jgi:lipopolysaccharide assembly outer membrane protein LptD (OstA)